MLLRDFVNKKMASADKEASAEGYPLTLNNCKKNKKMRQLELYGNSVQDGTPTPEAPVDVVSVGEKSVNLVKDAREVFKNFADYTELEEDGRECIRIKSNGGAYAIFDFTFKENTQYTISFEFKCKYDRSGVSLSYDVPFAVCYTDGNIDYCSIQPINNTWNKRVLTTIAGKTISHIKALGFDYRVYDYIDINTFQIQEGSTATPYEPFGKYKIPVVVKSDTDMITTNIFLNEPIRKLGDYADYVDFKNNKVVRKCCKRYLKDCGWNNGVSEYVKGVYCFTAIDNSILPTLQNSNGGVGKSNIFPMVHSHQQEKYTYAILMHSWVSNVQVVISSEYLSEKSVSAFKTWIEEYNPYMVRVLATPTEEPITCELPKLNAKISIIEVDTSLAPSNAYGKYIKK